MSPKKNGPWIFDLLYNMLTSKFHTAEFHMGFSQVADQEAPLKMDDQHVHGTGTTHKVSQPEAVMTPRRNFRVKWATNP